VWIAGTSVFPCGIRLELHVRWASARRIPVPLIPGDRGRRGLCLGILFDDGRRVLAVPRRRQARDANAASYLTVAPVAAGAHSATTEIWLWPLPTVSLTWALEWQDQRVAESRAPFDVTAIPEAASNARAILTRIPLAPVR